MGLVGNGGNGKLRRMFAFLRLVLSAGKYYTVHVSQKGATHIGHHWLHGQVTPEVVFVCNEAVIGDNMLEWKPMRHTMG